MFSLFKNKDFFKNLKTDDDLNYLAKFVEQLFSKIHFDASASAKNIFFVTSKILIKLSYFIEKEPEKSS
jgi:hypothetical protein